MFVLHVFLLGLSYTESSTGLDTPQMDGGRTEVEFADMDGDGNLDIVCVGDHGSPNFNTNEHGIMVWFGDGAGSWSVYQNGDFGYGGVAAGDVNNDGLLDVGWSVHHNYTNNDFGNQLIEVALGDGTGKNWTPWDDGLAGEGQDWGMFGTDFGDVDNDGWLDIGSNSFGADDGVWVYLNNHDGTWTNCFGFAGGNSGEDFVFGDVNRDGFLDFAVSHTGGAVYMGDGTGNFLVENDGLPSGELYYGISLGDVDNDGADDIAFITLDGDVRVYGYQEGSGSWQGLFSGLPEATSYQATQLADMDNDGNLDLVLFGAGTLSLYLGDGAGHWTSDTSFVIVNPDSSSGDFAALRAGPDADHNGFADILVVDDEGDEWGSKNTPRFFKESTPNTHLGIFPVYPRGNERFYGGSVRFVKWRGADAGSSCSVDLQISTTGSTGPWTSIATDLPNNGIFQWTVPNTPSDNCYLRYVIRNNAGDSAVAITPRAFEIIGTGVFEESAPAGDLLLFPTARGLRFYLAEDVLTEIALYDAKGALVQVLLNSRPGRGWHWIPWAKHGLGVFFVVMTAGSRCRSAKMVLRE